MLQYGRMEIVRELANVAGELERLLLKRREFLSQLLTDVVPAQPLLETAEGDRDTGQLLADVVVQVPRNPRPFDLLRPDQPARQILNLLTTRFERSLARAYPIFGLLPFGDVDVAADIAGVTAVRSVLRHARRQKPPVIAVGVAQPVLQEKGPPRFERRHVLAEAPVDILRMDEVQPAVLSQLFERPARQLLAEAIEVVECRVRPGGPDEDRRLIGPETKLLDALAQRSSLDQQAGNRRHENGNDTQNGNDDEAHRLSVPSPVAQRSPRTAGAAR